jgi:hypothetical protein
MERSVKLTFCFPNITFQYNIESKLCSPDGVINLSIFELINHLSLQGLINQWPTDIYGSVFVKKKGERVNIATTFYD